MESLHIPAVLGDDAARRLRLRAHRLDRPADGARAEEIVAALCGVQAQDLAGSSLSLWARGADLRPDRLDSALRDRLVVRTWAMRGTLHLLAAPDVRWVGAALAPVLTRPSARQADLGLDPHTLARSTTVLGEALSGGQQRTRAELAEVLLAAGIAPEGQRLPHMLHYAAVRGVICQGPPRSAEPTYVLLDHWLPPAPAIERDAALALLARRYLAGHGPAGLQDFAWWSGLPLAEARLAWSRIQPEIVAVTVQGQAQALLSSAVETVPGGAPPPSARLLPGFDSYLLAYRDRGLILDPAHNKRVNAGGGMLKPTVVVDGRVVGLWRRTPRRRRLRVTVSPFEQLGAEAVAAIAAEAARLGRALDLETELIVDDPS